jgi:hypothetical protein
MQGQRQSQEVVSLQVRRGAARGFRQVVNRGVILEQEKGVQRAVLVYR